MGTFPTFTVGGEGKKQALSHLDLNGEGGGRAESRSRKPSSWWLLVHIKEEQILGPLWPHLERDSLLGPGALRGTSATASSRKSAEVVSGFVRKYHRDVQ